MHESEVVELYNRWQATSIGLVGYHQAYEGDLTVENLGMSLPPELRALHTVTNWNRLVVDTIEERLDVTGFRMAGQSDVDSRLWEWWQANNLDEESSFAHLDSLIYGRSFVCVGVRDNDKTVPLITVESPESMYVETDPRTRQVRVAIRFYGDDPYSVDGATLMLPNSTHHFRRQQGGWTEDESLRNVHNLGAVPVATMVNRARIADRMGRSEMVDVMPLTNAACRALTNLQGAQELLAVPQRYIMGLSEKDFKNPDGSRKSPLEAYMARIWTMSNPDAKAGQFPAASLDNFATAININAKLASSLSGVPLRFFGVVSDVNPSSADAVRADESRLVKRAERKQRLYSGTWETVMALALRITGNTDQATTRLETRWRDPSTPTWSASAQAAVQLFQAGLIPKETAWNDLGYSPEQQKIMSEAMGDDPLNRLLATVEGDVGDDDMGTVSNRTGSNLTQNPIGGALAAAQSRG